jgi:opacity protein-like surface antigen
MIRVLGLSALLSMVFVSQASAQSGFGERPTIGVFGGLTAPTGDFGDEVSKGWHAGGLLKVRAYRALDVRVDGTYSKLGKKDIVGTDATLNTDGTVSFGTLSAVANMGPDSAMYPGDNSVSPYLVAGLGAYRLDYAATCTGTCDTFEAPEIKTNIGWNIGLGASLPLAGIRGFVEGRYHRISRSADIGGSRSMLLLSAGLRFR